MSCWPWATPHRVERAAGLIVLILAFLWPGWAAAQFRLRLGAEFDSESSSGKSGIAAGVLPVPAADGQALRKKLRFLRAYAETNSGSTHTQAADLYQDVLVSLENAPELQHDYFLPSEKEEKSDTAVTVNSTVRGEIDAAFIRLPSEVWRVYQLRFGVSAQRLLDEALAEGNLAGLERIFRLYFYTEAGYQAAYLLGEAYLDGGQPLSAVRCLRRLKDSPGARRFDPALTVRLATSYYLADDGQRAVATLATLRKEFPAVMLSVAGRDIPGPAAGDQGLTWLAALVGQRQAESATNRQWLVYRGNAARNAGAAGGEPIVLRWQAFASDNPQLVDEREGVIPFLTRRWEQRGQLALPSAQPLVIRRAARGGTGPREQALLVARTINGLVAMDLATGKRVLQSEEPEPAVVESASPVSPDLFGRLTAGSSPDSLERRLWNDGAVGQISSDGERVYQIKLPRATIEDEDEESPRARQRAGAAQARRRPGNMLQALTLPSDRGQVSVAWEIDGTSEPAQSPLAGVTFLGPPLPLRGVLYVLAEFSGTTTELSSGDTRLLAIDARNLEANNSAEATASPPRPKILWSQRVAQFDDALGSAMYGDMRGMGIVAGGRNLRRRVGLSPSAADGILVCPTGVGAVVAIDASTRSLRWGFKYPLGGALPDDRMRRRSENGSEAAQWIDGTATIAEGRVLLTSPLSQQLHCLNLADGKELWSAPREDGLYVAGVQQGKVVVVGSRKVRAFQLSATDAGGKLAWSQNVDLPAADRPAGHGFFAGDNYLLSLASGEIAVIDVEKGKLAKQLRSPEGRPLGNLIAYGDVVLSLGATSIDCFEQRQSLEASLRERLAKNPADPRALRDSAKRALYDGKPEEAAALLRQSLKARPDAQTQQLLVVCLTQLVQADAVKHRAVLNEVGELVQRRVDKVAYLRLLAASLRREGKTGEAMQTMLRLADVLGDRDVPVGDTLLSATAVVETAIGELYRTCPADQRGVLDAAVEKILAPALTAKDSRGLWRFLDLYGFHPSATKARRELVSRAIAAGSQQPTPSPNASAEHGPTPNLAEALWLLAQLERSSDALAASWATAQQARLLAQSGRTPDAAAAYRRLRGELAEQICLDGKNGKQLFDELPLDSPVRRCIDSPWPTWPTGEVDTEVVASSPTPRSLWPVTLEGATAWAEKTSLHFNSTTNRLLACDSVGQPLWELQLEAPSAGVPRSVSRAVALGHLLILQTGDEVLAIDVLRRERPEIRWRRSLSDGPLGRSGQAAAAGSANAWGLSGALAAQLGGFTTMPQGRLGSVTNRYICLQQEETLTVVHPLTGRTLWSRRGTPGGGLLFGDDDVLAMIASGGDKGLVLSAADGQIVGQPALAPLTSVVGTVGSRLIVWENRDGKQVLRVVEATGKELRRLGQFDAGSKATQVDDEAVAVLQPNGDFTVLRIADGREEFRRKALKLPNKLDRIHVARAGETYFVAISRPDEDRERAVWGLPRLETVLGDESNRPSVNGLVYAFSRSGDELWKDGANRVEGCTWALDLPSDLPVLVFVSDERARSSGQQMRIKLVDKRTGRTIYDHRRAGQPDAVQVQGDPEQGLIVLQLPGERVNLRFPKPKADKAPPPLEAPPPG